MKRRKSKKEKKRLFLISSTIIFLLCFLVSSVYSDWAQILENKSKVVALNTEYENLLEEEESLTSEITKLQDDNYLKRYAKEKFMFSEPGDTIIRMDE
jgi:cell division protein DivIC